MIADMRINAEKKACLKAEANGTICLSGSFEKGRFSANSIKIFPHARFANSERATRDMCTRTNACMPRAACSIQRINHASNPIVLRTIAEALPVPRFPNARPFWNHLDVNKIQSIKSLGIDSIQNREREKS